MSASSLKTIEKAIDILWAMAQRGGPSSADELAHQLGLPKSTTYRFLKTLQSKGFVESSPEYGRYQLGSALHLLSRTAPRNGSLRENAVSVLRRLTQETGETTFLCVKTGQEITCIECVESPQPVITRSLVGKVRPLHVGAASKVLLAFLPEEEIRAVLQRGLIKVTDNTITDPVRLRKEIDEIRKRGYAYSDQEFIPGARAVAAPVFDGAVAVVASLTLSAPIPRLGVPNRERVAHCVIKAAQEVSTSLGWRPD